MGVPGKRAKPAEIVALGGPCDGAVVHASNRAVFRWLDAKGRGHLKEAAGRALYKLEDAAWRYMGPNAWECTCGAVLTPDMAQSDERTMCHLCGASRVRAS